MKETKDIKVLFVNQEVEPYVVGSQIAALGLKIPQTAQEEGMEIRTFMPKFGVINERRNQLHEVIRLSGLNLVVGGADHPLIIKVASIQALRLQVYFIDNEDYFIRRGIIHDELGMPYSDNDQRALFFAKGVLETVKKLRWVPDVIHCNGWFTSFVPLLVRTTYANDPLYSRVKILFSLYDDVVDEPVGGDVVSALAHMKLPAQDLELVAPADHQAICQLAIRYSNAVAQGDFEVDEGLLEYATEVNKKVYDLRSYDGIKQIYSEIYEGVTA